MKNRILIAILLPVVAIAVMVALWATSAWVPPLVGYMQKRTDASLSLVTSLGLEKCERSLNYLLDLRLEDDEGMVAALKRETLSEIQSLSDRFDVIHVVVLDTDGEVISASNDKHVSTALSMKDLDISGAIVQQRIFDRPARLAANYFPFWRWYVAGYIFETDYAAPLNLARKVIFSGTLVVLLATIVTAALAFYLHVNQPLNRIIKASEKVTAGDFKKVGIVGKDEIGRVTQAFNTMVESLEADQRKINEIMTALRESEEMYRVVTENSFSQIMLMRKGEVIFANQRIYQDSGYTMKELIGGQALRHIHPDDRSAVRRVVRHRILGHVVSDPLKCRYLTKAGEVRWVELVVVPTMYKGESVVLIHGTDVTQRKAAFEEQQRLEAKLRQAQKMEAIGTLAGGIAHDFNNLLMSIQGNAALMQLKLPKTDPGYERLANIQQYVKNGAELTRQLLGYARGGKYEVKPLDVNALITQSAHMFGRTKKEIVVRLDLQEDLWSVEADRGQIEQVLLNLYVNAWQAMHGGGELVLKTENTVVNQAEEKHLTTRMGDYVLITVQDAGIGMDQETVQRIFDPFFTTKQRERGTGLGLASVYGIIRNHGGSIVCTSKPHAGTTFRIYLPRSDKTPATDIDAATQIVGGSETVLLVDDEAMVVEVGSEMLVHLGYHVLTANKGEDALRLIEKRGSDIDVVLLDMIMPGMSGAETFDAIREVRPDVPVLLCSGYSQDGQATELLNRGCNGFIQKPFNLNQLSQRVRDILEKKVFTPSGQSFKHR